MKAFTLIEIIMVIAIIGILAVISMPAFVSSHDALKVKSAYRQLMQDIRYVQQLSIARQQKHGIYFIGTGNSYFAYRQATGNTVIDPATRKQLSVFFGVVGQPATIMISSSYGVPGGVEFDSLGAPYSTGAATSSGGTVTLTYRGIPETITIGANTGRIQ